MTREYLSAAIRFFDDAPKPVTIPATDPEMSEAYKIYSRTVKEIIATTGLSYAAFGRKYSIPTRSIENWCCRGTTCPIYIRIFLQEAVGLLHFDE